LKEILEMENLINTSFKICIHKATLLI